MRSPLPGRWICQAWWELRKEVRRKIQEPAEWPAEGKKACCQLFILSKHFGHVSHLLSCLRPSQTCRRPSLAWQPSQHDAGDDLRRPPLVPELACDARACLGFCTQTPSINPAPFTPLCYFRLYPRLSRCSSSAPPAPRPSCTTPTLISHTEIGFSGISDHYNSGYFARTIQFPSIGRSVAGLYSQPVVRIFCVEVSVTFVSSLHALPTENCTNPVFHFLPCYEFPEIQRSLSNLFHLQRRKTVRNYSPAQPR